MAVNGFYASATPYGHDTFMRKAPTHVNARAVSAGGAAESFTRPTDARYVLLSANGDFYAHCTATATVPGDVSDGSAAELNPAGYDMIDLAENATISVISPPSGATVITATFYK